MNKNLFLLTIKARIAFATSAKTVPIIVLATVMYAPVIRLLFANRYIILPGKLSW